MASFFGQMSNDLKSIGKEVSRGLDDACRSADKTFNEHRSTALLDMFRSGNVVQFVSNRSGRCLQIVMSPDGRLVLDGCGMEGPTAYNTHWTVTDFGKNVVSLQNQANFLCIRDGVTQLAHIGHPSQIGPDAKFRLVQTGNFLMLESLREPGRHVGILNNGQLKSALATAREPDAHFGVRLIYSTVTVAHAVAPPPYHK